jgi:hypothetical protein
MRKQTNTLSPSSKYFQSLKFSDSDFREVRGLGLGRPKSSEFEVFSKSEIFGLGLGRPKSSGNICILNSFFTFFRVCLQVLCLNSSEFQPLLQKIIMFRGPAWSMHSGWKRQFFGEKLLFLQRKMSGAPTFVNQKNFWNQNHVILPSFLSTKFKT